MEVRMITKEDLRIIENDTLKKYVDTTDDIKYKIECYNPNDDMASITIEGKKKNADTVHHVMSANLFHESEEFKTSYEVNNGLYKIHREMLIKQQEENIKKIKTMKKQLEDIQDIAEDMGLTFEEILGK